MDGIRFRRATLRNMRVRVGEYHLYQAELGHSSLDLVPEKLLLHPLFGQPKRLSNDIGLLRVSSDIPMGAFAVPACLPSAAADRRLYAPGRNGTVAGWGYVRELRLGEHRAPGDSRAGSAVASALLPGFSPAHGLSLGMLSPRLWRPRLGRKVARLLPPRIAFAEVCV